jgi:hypothetical protein
MTRGKANDAEQHCAASQPGVLALQNAQLGITFYVRIAYYAATK